MLAVACSRFVAPRPAATAAATTATPTPAALAVFTAASASATTTAPTPLARFATTNDWRLRRRRLRRRGNWRGRGNHHITTRPDIWIHFDDPDLGELGNASPGAGPTAAAA